MLSRSVCVSTCQGGIWEFCLRHRSIRTVLLLLDHSLTSWPVMQHYLTSSPPPRPFAESLAGLRVTCMTWVFAMRDTLHYSLPSPITLSLRTSDFNARHTCGLNYGLGNSLVSMRSCCIDPHAVWAHSHPYSHLACPRQYPTPYNYPTLFDTVT